MSAPLRLYLHSPAGPTASPAVVADAREALERCHFLTWRIGRHPVLPRLPTLPVFLDGALCFLRDCRRHFPLDERARGCATISACARRLCITSTSRRITANLMMTIMRMKMMKMNHDYLAA